MRFCWAQYGLWAAVAILGLVSLFSGCGAKGDLFLPETPPSGNQSAESLSNDLPPSR